MIRFVETPLFMGQVVELLADSEYSELQAALIVQPDLGDLIPGSGGLRKMRWGVPSRATGKRGGMRVIYYWYSSEGVIYMLMAYTKAQREDLSAEQKRTLRKIAEGFK